MITNRLFVIRLSTDTEGVESLFSGSQFGSRAVKVYSRVGDARRVLGRLRKTMARSIDASACVLEVALETVEVH